MQEQLAGRVAWGQSHRHLGGWALLLLAVREIDSQFDEFLQPEVCAGMAAAVPDLQPLDLTPMRRETLNAAFLNDRIHQIGVIEVTAFEITASKIGSS